MPPTGSRHSRATSLRPTPLTHSELGQGGGRWGKLGDQCCPWESFSEAGPGARSGPPQVRDTAALGSRTPLGAPRAGRVSAHLGQRSCPSTRRLWVRSRPRPPAFLPSPPQRSTPAPTASSLLSTSPGAAAAQGPGCALRPSSSSWADGPRPGGSRGPAQGRRPDAAGPVPRLSHWRHQDDFDPGAVSECLICARVPSPQTDRLSAPRPLEVHTR